MISFAAESLLSKGLEFMKGAEYCKQCMDSAFFGTK